MLEVPDEKSLLNYVDDVAWQDDFAVTVFTEEDLGGEHTAMAAVCDGRHFSTLPLAGRSMAGV